MQKVPFGIIGFLTDNPGNVQVGFYVYWRSTFIFRVACESCLFVIINSWEKMPLMMHQFHYPDL